MARACGTIRRTARSGPHDRLQVASPTLLERGDERRSCTRRYAPREDPAISSPFRRRSHAFRSGGDGRSDTPAGHEDGRAVGARGRTASKRELCEQVQVVDGLAAQRRVLTEPAAGVPGNGVTDTVWLPVRHRSTGTARVVVRRDTLICCRRERVWTFGRRGVAVDHAGSIRVKAGGP
jgi:hypothetical protein